MEVKYSYSQLFNAPLKIEFLKLRHMIEKTVQTIETFLYMLSKNYVLLSSGVIIEVRVYWNSLNRQFNWRTNILNNQIFQSI